MGASQVAPRPLTASGDGAKRRRNGLHMELPNDVLPLVCTFMPPRAAISVASAVCWLAMRLLRPCAIAT